MEYVWKDARRNDDYNDEIAQLYQQGFNAYRIFKILERDGKKIACSTVYAKVKRLNEHYERVLRRNLGEFE